MQSSTLEPSPPTTGLSAASSSASFQTASDDLENGDKSAVAAAAEKPPPPPPRSRLPVPQSKSDSSSLWSFLKQCIGRELSKITMPVQWNEPVSFLQRLSEYMNYAHLLKAAASLADPEKRMLYVSCFAVSSLSSNVGRLGKPFNPLLGETFEMRERDFRIVCEQVRCNHCISTSKV